jgi:uncharacterized protein involved in exopolysaccharide biosynthesis
MIPEHTPGERFVCLVSRWRFLVLVAGCAAALAFGVSELLPRRYTATATVIIDPPAANDAHTATALNPTYLESLRTFEHFFTSDTLFQQAAARFHLDASGEDVDTLRRKVLKVSIEHETRILEVSATLPDPRAAKNLVEFIAEQSIAANREDALGADADALRTAASDAEQARTRAVKAQAEWERAAGSDTPESIESAVESATRLLSETRGLEGEAEADREAWRVRAQDGAAADREYAQLQARVAGARANEYAQRGVQLDAELATRRRLLADLAERQKAAADELEAAREAFESAQARVRDISARAGTRTERMRIIDPGVDPRKPSSPTVLLNTLAATLLALCLSVVWVTLRMPERRSKPAVVRNAQRLA